MSSPMEAGVAPGTRGLPLAARITLALLAVVAVAAAGLGWFGRQVVLDQFAATEMQLVRQNRTILDRVIATEVEHLQAIATDWGQWDDLYEYVQGRNPGFQESELGNVVLDRLGLDAILLLDPTGRLYYGDVRTGDPAPRPAESATALATLLSGTARRGDVSHPPRSSILPEGTSRVTTAGLLDTPLGPIALAMRAVSRTDGSGAPVGTLVMARYLRAEELFANVSVLPSDVISHGSGADPMSRDLHLLAKELVGTPAGSRLVMRRDDMSDFKIFGDLAGKPAFMLETRMPRSIVAVGRETAQLLLAGVLVAAVVSLVLLNTLISRLVSTPLQRLTSHMLALRERGEPELQPTPGLERNDEVGALARRFEDLEAVRRETEAELRNLSAVVEFTAERIVVLDATGRIRYVNPAYERNRGIASADIVGKRPGDAQKGHDSPAHYDEMWRTVRSGRTWTGRITTELSDHRIITEEAVVSPVITDGAEPGSYVIILHDVTDRIRLEEQLAQARKLEAVGQLAAGVAHEINTPTQYVGGNIRFLRDAFTTVTNLLGDIARLARGAGDGPVPAGDLARVLAAADVDYLRAEVPVAIRQSLEGVERVGEIVKSMRELAHPARDFAVTNVNDVVESAVRVAGGEWQGLADVRTELDPGLPLIPCLAGGINQVIVNMLVNSAHAIEARGPVPRGRIVVATRQAGDCIEIRITDNGAGMAEDVRARVFDPFFTTKDVGRGTGQGLAIAHSVVKKHRGSIVVESEQGRGTSFTIRLPLDPGLMEGAGRGSEAAA